MKRAAALAALAAALAAVVLYDVRHVELEADITAFVPELEEQVELEIVRALSKAPAGRLVATTLGGADPAARREAARELRDALADDPHFAWAVTGSGLETRGEDGLTQTLFAHRFGLMDVPLDDQGRVPDAELERRARAMYRTLATPLGSMLRPVLGEDPLFAFGDLVARLRASAGDAVTDMGGVWETRDGSRTLVLAVAKAGGLSGQAQRETLAVLDAAVTAQKTAHPGLEVDSTSVGHYAVGAEAAIRGDIQRISLWSTLGILALYLWAFRSLRWPLTALLPLACGVAVALCGVSLIFGPVHGMALGFGAGLLGVAVDYAAHYFVHRASAPDDDRDAVMRRVFPGVALGAVTTMVGVAAFIVTPSRGFRQMGTLALLGIAVALAATRYVLPAVAGPARRVTAGTGLAPLTALGTVLRSHPGPLRVATALLVGGALLGLSRARWEDDVRALQPELPEVEATSQRVRAALGRGGAHDRFVVGVGQDDDEALLHAEQAAAQAHEAIAGAGGKAGAGLGALRAPSRQRTVLRALREDSTLQGRLDRALDAAGFSPEAFTPLATLLKRAPGPLAPETVLDRPWGRPWSLSRVPLPGGNVAYTIPVPAEHAEAAEHAVGPLNDAYYVDPPRVMSHAYGLFRKQALWLFAVGLALVWCVLFARYRAVRPATACWLSAVVSCGAALGVQAWGGIPFNPLHLLGVLLVASMAVDYSVYQLEANDALGRPPALASAALAAITTLLSLGLLGTSELPALAAIGLTAALGVGFAFLCATVVASLQGAPR